MHAGCPNRAPVASRTAITERRGARSADLPLPAGAPRYRMVLGDELPLDRRLRQLLPVAGLDRSIVAPGELARERTHCNAEFSGLPGSVAPLLGHGSGLTGKARCGKCLAAGLWVCSQCRTTESERQCQRRE